MSQEGDGSDLINGLRWSHHLMAFLEDCGHEQVGARGRKWVTRGFGRVLFVPGPFSCLSASWQP
jgi:hypothetical protein